MEGSVSYSAMGINRSQMEKARAAAEAQIALYAKRIRRARRAGQRHDDIPDVVQIGEERIKRAFVLGFADYIVRGHEVERDTDSYDEEIACHDGFIEARRQHRSKAPGTITKVAWERSRLRQPIPGTRVYSPGTAVLPTDVLIG